MLSVEVGLHYSHVKRNRFFPMKIESFAINELALRPLTFRCRWNGKETACENNRRRGRPRCCAGSESTWQLRWRGGRPAGRRIGGRTAAAAWQSAARLRNASRVDRVRIPVAFRSYGGVPEPRRRHSSDSKPSGRPMSPPRRRSIGRGGRDRCGIRSDRPAQSRSCCCIADRRWSGPSVVGTWVLRRSIIIIFVRRHSFFLTLNFPMHYCLGKCFLSSACMIFFH